MLGLALGLILAVVPGHDIDNPDVCAELLPAKTRAELPVGSIEDAQQTWTEDRAFSADSLRSIISQLEEARSCFLELPPGAIDAPSAPVIKSFYWEIHLQAALRHFPEAFEAFDEALSYLNTTPQSNSAAETRQKWASILHQDRGYLHFLLGNLSASIEHYVKAYEATPEANTAQRTRHLVDVGILYQRTQDYRAARSYYRRAQDILSTADPSGEAYTEEQVRLFLTQADLLLEQTVDATFDRESLERARALAERARTLTDPGTLRRALASLVLSESLGYLGDFDTAYTLNDRVRHYARTNQDRRRRTLALLKLGVLHVQTGRWAQADSVLRDALTQAEELGDLDYQRRILRTLGRLLEMQERWSEAEHFYRKGVTVVEEYRKSLTASQWSMTAFAQWREVHRGLVRSLLAQDRPREALTALDQSRARHLQDLRTQARISNQLPPEQRTRFDSLSRALSNVRNQLGEASLPPREKATLRNRETRLMAARQQLLRLDSTRARPSLDAVSHVLAEEDRVLVSYFLDDPWPVFDRSPRSTAFILSSDTLRTVSLPDLTQDSVRSLVEAISPLFSSRTRPNRANAMHFNLRPLHQLYEAVYAPVAAHLPGSRPLTVIPDGPLFHTPFSMLVRAMPGGRFSPGEARYLLHARPTSVELASSFLADSARRTFDWSKFRPEVAAYGVSTFDTLRTVSSHLRSPLSSPSDSSLTLPSLPGVREELQALESTVPGARVFLNDQATEADFCRSARQAGVLHVASHAFVNAASPLQNAILLRPDSTVDSSSDGMLFLHELQAQRSRIPMVVLSGCNTATGTLRGGEGMEGLQYAFRAMGAQSTVSTLWPVADRVSVTLMDAFYDHLQDGHPKDVALRQAQLDFLDAHPQKASPFFWAPLVLYGSPAPLPFDDPFLPLWTWWALGAAGLLLLAGGLLWWNRNRLPAPFC